MKKKPVGTLTTDFTVGGSCLGSPTRTSLLQRWISGISVSTSQDCPAFCICKQDKKMEVVSKGVEGSMLNFL